MTTANITKNNGDIKMVEKKYPYSIRLSDKNLEQLSKISNATSISKNAVIRLAINELYNTFQQKEMIQ